MVDIPSNVYVNEYTFPNEDANYIAMLEVQDNIVVISLNILELFFERRKNLYLAYMLAFYNVYKPLLVKVHKSDERDEMVYRHALKILIPNYEPGVDYGVPEQVLKDRLRM